MSTLLSPPRSRGAETLDTPDTDPRLSRRSLRDVAVANRLFGGTHAVLTALEPVWSQLPRHATLLDVGTGMGDIPARARQAAARTGVTLETVGLEATSPLAAANRGVVTWPVCGDARALPFADHSVDVVTCSQVLHHFFDADARFVLAEMNRVARVQAIVSDIHRSRIAAAGIWVASFALAFHPASRHDAVVSVMRGFHVGELRQMVRETLGVDASVRYRPGYRITASWAPSRAPGPSAA
jgi:2-polyprenyl-3-methyl-5-hydroxy-6-metoxy-1,4-benzoquinol methylase